MITSFIPSFSKHFSLVNQMPQDIRAQVSLIKDQVIEVLEQADQATSRAEALRLIVLSKLLLADYQTVATKFL